MIIISLLKKVGGRVRKAYVESAPGTLGSMATFILFLGRRE
jgi:hypothetical protein